MNETQTETSQAKLVPVFNSPITFNVTNTELERMRSQYMPLTIKGIEDRAGYKAVYEARQVVKNTRIELGRYAKNLREDAQAWAKKVIAEEKRVIGELEKIEDHLQQQENAVNEQLEKIKKEKEQKAAAQLQARIDELAQYGYSRPLIELKVMDAISYEAVVNEAKALHAQAEAERLERERIAAEQAETERRQAEAERLRSEAMAAQIARQQAIIDDQNRILAEAQAIRERAAKEAAEAAAAKFNQRVHEMLGAGLNKSDDVFLFENLRVTADEVRAMTDSDFEAFVDSAADTIAKAKAKAQLAREMAEKKAIQEARDKAAAEAREKLLQEQAEEKRKAEAAADKAARKAARVPDKQKLYNFCEYLLGIVPDFELKSPEAIEVLSTLLGRIEFTVIEMRKKVDEL
jgi:chemosensory pili system protein ChpA (sensor histidine kinase/response regulator)